MKIFTQLDRDTLEIFKEKRDHKLRSLSKVIIDTEKVALRFVKLNKPTEVLILTETIYEKNKALLEQANVEKLFILKKSDTSDIVGYNIHQGVMALGQRPDDVSIENLGDKVLVLNGVNNAENVGAICRSALAFGVDSIIIDSQSCSPFVRRAIRVSMGSVFKLKFMHTDQLAQVLRELNSRKYSIVSASNDENAIRLKDVNFAERCALILGNEGEGVDHLVKELSDAVVKIPINPEVDSLNVAVASSILLYELGDL